MQKTLLYKLSSSNQLQWWEISHNTIQTTIRWGIGPTPFDSGHNLVYDYTEVDYQSRINHQIERKGWSVNHPRRQPDLPMLALPFDFNNPMENIPTFIIQPKIDGIRGLATKDGIRSRTDLPFNSCPYITSLLHFLPEDVKLDGELYIPKSDFSTVESYIMRQSPNIQMQSIIEYRVFDLVDDTLPFVKRYYQLLEIVALLTKKWLQYIDTKPTFWDKKHFPIKLVKNTYVNNTIPVPVRNKLLKETLKEYKSNGYEGLIIRDPNSPYELNKRSKGLYKLKEFEDNEFLIVDIIEGKGKIAVMVCETQCKSDTFNCSLKADAESKRAILYHKDKFIGRWLKVEHEGINPTGKPRCPVGVHIFEKKPNS